MESLGLIIDTKRKDTRDKNVSLAKYLEQKNWNEEHKKSFKSTYNEIKNGILNKKSVSVDVKDQEILQTKSPNHYSLSSDFPNFKLPKINVYKYEDKEEDKKYIIKVFKYFCTSVNISHSRESSRGSSRESSRGRRRDRSRESSSKTRRIRRSSSSNSRESSRKTIKKHTTKNNKFSSELIQQMLYVTKEIFMQRTAYDILYHSTFKDTHRNIQKLFKIPKIEIVETSNLKTVIKMEYLEPIELKSIISTLNTNFTNLWFSHMYFFFEHLRKYGFYHNDTAYRNVYFTTHDGTHDGKLAVAVIDFGESEININPQLTREYNPEDAIERGTPQHTGLSLIGDNIGFRHMNREEFIEWMEGKFENMDNRNFVYGGIYGGTKDV